MLRSRCPFPGHHAPDEFYPMWMAFQLSSPNFTVSYPSQTPHCWIMARWQCCGASSDGRIPRLPELASSPGQTVKPMVLTNAAGLSVEDVFIWCAITSHHITSNHYSSFVGAAPVLISKDSLEVHFALIFSDFWVLDRQGSDPHIPCTPPATAMLP